MLNHVASFTPADWSQARLAFILANDFQKSFRITLPEYIKVFDVFGPFAANPEAKPDNDFKNDLCRPLFGTPPT